METGAWRAPREGGFRKKRKKERRREGERSRAEKKKEAHETPERKGEGRTKGRRRRSQGIEGAREYSTRCRPGGPNLRWNSQDGPSAQPPPGPGHVTPVNLGVYEVASGLCPCRVVNPWQHISAQGQPLAVCSHTDRQGHWKWVPPRNNPLHGRRQRYCSKTDPRGWWKLAGQKCLGVTAPPEKFSNPGDPTGI